MPNRCSAPGCRSNYDGEPYTPVFRLPVDKDIVQEWLQSLHREGINDLKNIFVCAKHFRSEDVITEVDITQPDGSITKIKRRPILRENACPCFLPNCPSYLSSQQVSTKPKRLNLGEKDFSHFSTALHQSHKEFDLEQATFGVKSISDVRTKLIHYELPFDWLVWSPNPTTINFILPSTSGNTISIKSYISVDESLTTLGFYQGSQIPLSISKINDIRQLSTLITEVSEYKCSALENDILRAVNCLNTVASSLKEIEEIPEKYTHFLPSMQFIICQLENLLVPKTRRTYDLTTMVLALKCQIISPACYNFLQSQECLILPHHTTLHRLYTSIGLDNDFISYLRISTQDFNSQERNVILHMDEIHVKSDFSYTGGRIIGSSITPNTPATTVLAFMVSSLCRKWSTIVHLLPCSKTSASQLFPITKQIITDIENCDLIVRVLCTDNYPLNVNLFKLFSPSGILEPSVPHPSDPTRTLNLMFDFVHIIKTIRNNWINQKDPNHTFTFPSFDDFTLSNSASFEDIRVLYKEEQRSVAKTAHRLTAKSCWPSNLERQNVGLALRIFNDSTSAALQLKRSKKELSVQTSEFISLITRIWKIFNVGTPNKGVRLNDTDSQPLRNNDTRFIFLSRVVEWLDFWKSMPGKHGKLTCQTFTSFRHSCICLQNTVNILTGPCQFAYVLSSFLQNDPIEHHFGLYRMMSGAQYNITLCQILETERRIKLSGILKLFSRLTNRPDSLREFFESFSNTSYEDDSSVIDLTSYSHLLEIDFSTAPDLSLLQALAFIAGYTVHSIYKNKVFRKLRPSNNKSMCSNCLALLTEDKILEFEESNSVYALIQLQDRGGLKWPSVPVLEAVSMMWSLFVYIENDPNLFNQFLSGPSRRILVTLTSLKVENDDVEFWRNTCSNCDTFGWEYLNTILRITANCILSNAVKNLNSLKLTLTPRDDNRKIKKFKSST